MVVPTNAAAPVAAASAGRDDSVPPLVVQTMILDSSWSKPHSRAAPQVAACVCVCGRVLCLWMVHVRHHHHGQGSNYDSERFNPSTQSRSP